MDKKPGWPSLGGSKNPVLSRRPSLRLAVFRREWNLHVAVRCSLPPRFFDRTEDRLVRSVAERFGVSPEMVRMGRWRELGIDSLELVELVMELEDEMDTGDP